jgi:two-component system sensor histidine kinase PhoQ
VRISVTGSPGREIRMVVADDGPGIPEEAVETLLQRGTRLDENTPGHGIGLAVVKELAESFGGTLEIGRSELGGAQFEITIP